MKYPKLKFIFILEKELPVVGSYMRSLRWAVLHSPDIE
jgi:hypothetical protein